MSGKKNFKHRWSILCQSSNIDKESNNLSIFNILEELRVTPPNQNAKEIIVRIPLQLITLWEKQTEKETARSKVEIELFDPKGNALQKVSYALSTPKKRIRFVVRMDGIKVTESGEYIFKIKIGDSETDRFEEVGEVPLQVAIDYPFPRILKP